MKVIQVSDLHLSTEETFHSVRVHEQLDAVLKETAGLKPDLLVLSGDLAAVEGGLEIYEKLKEKLKAFPAPYIIMPGNHDKQAELRSVFSWPVPLEDEKEIYFKLSFGDSVFLFLDTTEYQVSAKQLDWLATTLEQLPAQVKPLLFMHHPPAALDCPFMDGYKLKNGDEVMSVLSRFPKLRTVFCGHYHTNITVQLGEMDVHICPSTFLQVNPRASVFEIVSTQPGYRVIDVDNGKMTTEVRWASISGTT
jgi:Icc protein